MNIYSKKQVWKLILGVLAMLIVATSLLYTNNIVNEIETNERKQVRIWAEAIQKKAALVNYTQNLFKKIALEERKKVELWAEAVKRLANADFKSDYTFVLKVVADNTTVPVILTDEDYNVVSHRNLDEEKSKDPNWLKEQIREMRASREPIEVAFYGDKKNYMFYKDSKLFTEQKQVLDDIIQSFISETVVNAASVPVIYTDQSQQSVLGFGNIDSNLLSQPSSTMELIKEMRSQNTPIEITISAYNSDQLSSLDYQGDGESKHYIFYKDSFLLTKLKYYPLVQFFLIGGFIGIAYWLFSIARKSEQNQVWVGMAKETAHQLGTPLSSLMAWLEFFKIKGLDESTIKEIDKDLDRLKTIAERFSKIGSAPELVDKNIVEVLTSVIDYIKKRTSSRVVFTFHNESDNVPAKLNPHLFEWVIENLLRNAIDSMRAEGKIDLFLTEVGNDIIVDVQDTGAGIPSNKQKTVFQPGYTTKKRGWGLGLSLAKRIIHEYHKGKIFVKNSEVGKGTTFRIILKKMD
ncbi:MAG: HAMP domain-containing histidine kinase [Flavobacteriales bacterium]|nr:HAMP domain-containing histidine kinase [Flavobacteriales bacterium]